MTRLSRPEADPGSEGFEMRRQTKAPSSNRTMLAGMARLIAAAVLASPGPARAQDEQPGMADMRIAEQYAAHAADAQRLEDVRANCSKP